MDIKLGTIVKSFLAVKVTKLTFKIEAL